MVQLQLSSLLTTEVPAVYIREPVNCYHLYSKSTGRVPISAVDCECGFRNIICCPYPGKKLRLYSKYCMECGKVLKCPDCWGSELVEGGITDLDSILVCPKCGLWFTIW